MIFALYMGSLALVLMGCALIASWIADRGVIEGAGSGQGGEAGRDGGRHGAWHGGFLATGLGIAAGAVFALAMFVAVSGLLPGRSSGQPGPAVAWWAPDTSAAEGRAGVEAALQQGDPSDVENGGTAGRMAYGQPSTAPLLRDGRTVSVAEQIRLITLGRPEPEPVVDEQTRQEALAMTPGAEALASRYAVMLDGMFGDWPASADARADGEYLYVRLSLGQRLGLQSLPVTVAWMIDADGDATTGQWMEVAGGYEPLGVDLAFQFSPAGPDGRPSTGVAAMHYKGSSPGRGAEAGGMQLGEPGDRNAAAEVEATFFDHAQADFAFAPTYAAMWYEMRISRSLDALGVVESGLRTRGWVRGAFALLDEQGRPTAWGRPFQIQMPARSNHAKGLDVDLPAAPARAFRVVSMNVLNSLSMSQPAPFRRVLRALKPDVLMFQEWYETSDAQLEDWLKEHVDDTADWQVTVNPLRGAVVASRSGLTAFAGGGRAGMPATVRDVLAGNDAALAGMDVRTRRAIGRDWPFAVAQMRTPAGATVGVSVHLKCCGGVGTSEDEMRMDQVGRIRRLLGTSRHAQLIAGDLNLVGSADPLAVLLSPGERRLRVAWPYVLGGTTNATWGGPGSQFSPGRLDYVLYSDDRFVLKQNFVLDTTMLSEQVLTRHGLMRGDTTVSDHRPVVVDLARR